jgi:serine/threonine protein kinase
VSRATARPEFLDLEGKLFDGRFRVERYVAEGGFAVVYKAFQLALDRRVALKILKAPLNALQHASRLEFHEAFASEARTIARLRHPHIVDVYDFSVAELPNGSLVPWMALEWLEGETLAMRLERRRAEGGQGLPPREAVSLLRPVLEALAYAHGQGVVHRDIKPSNVMISETTHGQSLRVLDFGIAKIVAGDQLPKSGDTRTESVPAFSPAYASPEQVAFSRTGVWTDVHALGLLLTELMTDGPPFSGPDPDGHMFERVMSATRPTPASKGRDVGAFEPIIAKALALAPSARWKNAGELLAALDAAVSSDTWQPDNRRRGGPARGRRWRWPVDSVWGRMALGLASIAIIAGIFGFIRLRGQRSKLRSTDRTSSSRTAPGELACARRPELALSPAQGPAVPAGTVVPFKLAIRNTNAAGCPVETIYSGVNSRWPLIPEEDNIKLDVASGQTAYDTLHLASLRNAPKGDYDFQIRVTEDVKDTVVTFRMGKYVVGSVVESTGVALVPRADGSFDKRNAAGVVGHWRASGDAYPPEGKPDEAGTCPRAGFPRSACAVIATPRLGQRFRPDPSGRGMCTSGRVAPVVRDKTGNYAYGPIWGASIGFDLASSEHGRVYDAIAHGITGVAFDIDVVPEGLMRIAFTMPGGKGTYWGGAKRGYSPINTPGRYEIRWPEVNGPFWLPDPPLFDPRKIESIQFGVPASFIPVPFSFCIKNVEMLTN